MILEVKNQDILYCSELFIAHQCVSEQVGKGIPPIGLTRTIFTKYKYADTYTQPFLFQLNPGDISVHHEADSKTIINCYSQIFPTKPTNPFYDTEEDRLGLFLMCLDKISMFLANEKVAFPYRFGCGLAGGNWSSYERIFDSHKLRVVLYNNKTVAF